MVRKLWLIDFDANDHVDVLLLESTRVRDEPVDRLQGFHINIDVYSSFDIHHQVAKEVGFDDLRRK